MEYIAGGTLQDILERGAQEEEEGAAIARQLMQALGFLHSKVCITTPAFP